MRRINTTNKSADLHGTGKDGFKETPVPPTELSGDWCNDVQEEIANAIEDMGDALAADDTQLAQRVNRVVEPLIGGTFAVPGGLEYTATAGLAADLSEGDLYIYDATSGLGRRMRVTDAILTSDSQDSHTFTASRDTYVSITADASNNLTYTFTELANGSDPPLFSKDAAVIALVITDGSAITSIHNNPVTASSTQSRYTKTQPIQIVTDHRKTSLFGTPFMTAYGYDDIGSGGASSGMIQGSYGDDTSAADVDVVVLDRVDSQGRRAQEKTVATVHARLMAFNSTDNSYIAEGRVASFVYTAGSWVAVGTETSLWTHDSAANSSGLVVQLSSGDVILKFDELDGDDWEFTMYYTITMCVPQSTASAEVT